MVFLFCLEKKKAQELCHRRRKEKKILVPDLKFGSTDLLLAAVLDTAVGSLDPHYVWPPTHTHKMPTLLSLPS